MKQEVLHVCIGQADGPFLQTIIFHKWSKKYICLLYLQQHIRNKLWNKCYEFKGKYFNSLFQ